MSAYDNDDRVRHCDGGFNVRVQYGKAVLQGRVEPVGDGRWRSFWTEDQPLPKWHDTADEGIRLFIGDPQ